MGVRPPLIALNVWLPEGTLTEARAIAARVREAGGGPPGVRALGLYLPEAGMAQVSMNIEDHRAAPPALVIAAVRSAAEALGVESGDAELVGLVPREALGGPSPSALRIGGLRPGQILELKAPGLRRGAPRPGLTAWPSARSARAPGRRPCTTPSASALEASGQAPKASGPRLKPGEPAPPSMRGVLLRAGIVAALFYPYLIYIVGSSPGGALVVTVSPSGS